LRKRDAQLVVISTAGEVGGEFEDERGRLRQSGDVVEHGRCFTRSVRPGSSVLHDWSVPEDGDVEDFELVAAANPFAGVSVESLREKRELPGMTAAWWSRFTCNLAARASEAAITEREWAAARSDVKIPAGVPVWAGLDLGWKLDTTALVPLWWRDEEFQLFGPAVVLEPPRNGEMLPVDDVKAAIADLHERNPVEALVMDMTGGADVAQWASDEFGLAVVDRPQGNTFQVGDYSAFMAGLRSRTLYHSGDDGLSRHALNAVAKVLPGGDVKFARPKEARVVSQQRARVIDALVAAAMVYSTAAGSDVESEPLVAFA
jgi:phage terminase large subunit-like protein